VNNSAPPSALASVNVLAVVSVGAFFVSGLAPEDEKRKKARAQRLSPSEDTA
jgi:hypothetical protein